MPLDRKLQHYWLIVTTEQLVRTNRRTEEYNHLFSFLVDNGYQKLQVREPSSIMSGPNKLSLYFILAEQEIKIEIFQD